MNKYRRNTLNYFLLIISAGVALAACTRMGESSIKLPANPILTGGLGWAVVKDAYVRLKASPSDSARDIDYLRRGGVFLLEARAMNPESGLIPDSGAESRVSLWYCLSSEGTKGWVRESELDVYSSQAQAEKASAIYR
jgi:hypothetical protein